MDQLEQLPALAENATRWLIDWAPMLVLAGCAAALLAALISLRGRRADPLGPRRGVGVVVLVAALLVLAAWIALYGDRVNSSVDSTNLGTHAHPQDRDDEPLPVVG